ncbi:DUF3784 domain-containing protein [Geobacillus sp. NFOSA3]|nr:DUF3784 domain-containing protein [Geobacillus sp. NFOSA3]PDM40812.1 DUF3784 domain-containing protein [Parageobacillus yumthangensis]PUF89386.1 DUF3784 domain-containing protein [Geobacillus sp. LYN3]RDV21371.1 DUF3784 domain-containing protein [Parageobacillus toebii]TXK87285.1 DUF3784 domain-containing protein [Geobacillus sp. AYS3]TXK87904.1 DUF3784 domain-containing protein [Parageobacillus sp. SY1]
MEANMSLNTDFSTAIVICIITGLLFILVGWLIWKKKKLKLIAGYDEKQYKGDKNKLARVMGIYSITLGVIIIIFPFLMEYLGDWSSWILIGIIVFLTLFTLIRVYFK